MMKDELIGLAERAFKEGYECGSSDMGFPGTYGPDRRWKTSLALRNSLPTNDAEFDHAEQGDAIERLAKLEALINTPEVDDFARGTVIEAAHQRDRWGSDHDVGKAPLDWFWLIGYLAQKAATAQMAGDTEKALHHTISTAAALANWHLAISGADTAMRPGIEPPARHPRCPTGAR